MDNIKENKKNFQDVKDLFKKYEDDKEAFKEFDDEEMSDKTEYFLMEISEEANELFSLFDDQITQIDGTFLEFCTYVGEDKKLTLEEFLNIIKKFADSLEVNYLVFYYFIFSFFFNSYV
jgi:hypothetical protein